jgi:hypothetical protein
MVYGDVLGGTIPSVDLFATRRNAHCAKYYTASTDAFKHAWVHESAHANPPFRGATAARAVVRGYTEWIEEISNHHVFHRLPPSVGRCTSFGKELPGLSRI